MKNILALLLLCPLFGTAQTLSDYYKRERIGIGLDISYLNIPGSGRNSLEYLIKPVIVWDIRLQKNTPKGIFFQYSNLISGEMLTDLIIYRSVDDGNTPSRNITSGFFGNINIGRNILASEKYALSAGALFSTSYFNFERFSYNRISPFYLNGGIFINYDFLMPSYWKLRIYADLSKSLTDNSTWAWEKKDLYTSTFPYITNFIAELNARNGIYISAEFTTVFYQQKYDPYFTQRQPHPFRVNLGGGYRFNF